MAEFYIGDYLDFIENPITQLTETPKPVYYWRGYSFEVGSQVTITSLIGSIRVYRSGAVGHVGLYSAESAVNSGEESVKPKSLLASANMYSAGYGQRLDITPVTLSPGQLYIIAQGAGQAESTPITFCMGAVENYDDTLNSQIVNETVLSKFEPLDAVQLYKSWVWDHPDDDFAPANIVDRLPGRWQQVAFNDNANARPGIGFGMGFNIWVKKSGEWIQVTDIWTKKGGVWQAVTDVSTLKGGSWNTV